MISRLHLATILFISGLIWGVLLAVFGGIAVSIGWLRFLSTVTGILLVILLVFDRWIWKWSFLHDWFVKRPVVNGTWHCKIHSSWVGSSTGQPLSDIDGYMVIRQTYSSLSLRLMTKESSSELIGAETILSKDGLFQIVGVYRNEPQQLLRGRSNIHYGAIILQVIGKPPTALKGSYWTDRNTLGEIQSVDRHEKIFFDFETANQGFNSVTR